jgi:hypothetical protein
VEGEAEAEGDSEYSEQDISDDITVSSEFDI